MTPSEFGTPSYMRMEHSHPNAMHHPDAISQPSVKPKVVPTLTKSPTLEIPPHIGLQNLLPETTITSILRPTGILSPDQQFASHQREESLLMKQEPIFQPYPRIKLEDQQIDNEDISMEDYLEPTSQSSKSKGKGKKASCSDHENDDIANVTSLQTRIQILQQKFGIPHDAPLELINGGHGIKNPMVSDTAPNPAKEVEKLPPLRCETDPSKFLCRICSKAFTLQRLLNRHMKCHSDTKRYLGTVGGKGFNDTFDLKRHTRTHTGVRPYKCNLCEKSFTQRCSLESHCIKVHGVKHNYEYKQRRSKVYVCEECGHTTKEPEMHYLHLKDQHPYSPALLKFYDKRHFKFNNSNFASMLLSCN
jgi:hypothetical protein